MRTLFGVGEIACDGIIVYSKCVNIDTDLRELRCLSSGKECWETTVEGKLRYLSSGRAPLADNSHSLDLTKTFPNAERRSNRDCTPESIGFRWGCGVQGVVSVGA